jgi:hypothetical protein
MRSYNEVVKGLHEKKYTEELNNESKRILEWAKTEF